MGWWSTVMGGGVCYTVVCNSVLTSCSCTGALGNRGYGHTHFTDQERKTWSDLRMFEWGN